MDSYDECHSSNFIRTINLDEIYDNYLIEYIKHLPNLPCIISSNLLGIGIRYINKHDNLFLYEHWFKPKGNLNIVNIYNYDNLNDEYLNKIYTCLSFFEH